MSVAINYAAKSTQDRRGSIPDQLTDNRAMCEREGWPILGEYSDEGFSAYRGNRGPGLTDARAHAASVAAETGEVVMLVCQHSDRISRGAGDRPGAAEALIEIWHAERRRNVHLRSVQDDYDLRTSATVANIGSATARTRSARAALPATACAASARTAPRSSASCPTATRWRTTTTRSAA